MSRTLKRFSLVAATLALLTTAGCNPATARLFWITLATTATIEVGVTAATWQAGLRHPTDPTLISAGTFLYWYPKPGLTWPSGTAEARFMALKR